MPMQNRRNEVIPNRCDGSHFGPHSTPPSVVGSCKGCSSMTIRVQNRWICIKRKGTQTSLESPTVRKCSCEQCFKTVLSRLSRKSGGQRHEAPLKTLKLYTDRSKTNEGTGARVTGSIGTIFLLFYSSINTYLYKLYLRSTGLNVLPIFSNLITTSGVLCLLAHV